MALAEVAAEAAEKGELLRGFDPFGDGFEAECLGEGDDGLDDGAVVGVVGETGDERTVDLEGLDRATAEDVEAGVAGAEVVDREAKAAGPERGQGLRRGVGVLEADGLGDLQGEALWRETGLGQDGLDLSDDTGLHELAGGEVDAEWERVSSG